MNIKYYIRYWLFLRKSELITREYDSIYDIPFDINHGLILFDIDDTLGENEGIISERTVKFVNDLCKRGFTIALISNCNNGRENYIKNTFSRNDIEVVTRSNKPNPKSITKIMSKHKYVNDSVYMIGDRVATDLYAAYLAGIKNRYLVKPYSQVFSSKKPGFVYSVFRIVENWVARNTL